MRQTCRSKWDATGGMIEVWAAIDREAGRSDIALARSLGHTGIPSLAMPVIEFA